MIQMLIGTSSCMNGSIPPEIQRKFARDHIRVNNNELFAKHRNHGLSKCTLADSIRSRDDKYEWCLHECFVHFSSET